MSNAMVAAGAIADQRDGGGIEVAFSGRFGFGIYRWAYLPFDVPAGVQQIRVTASHDDFAVAGLARNVLDLGIFGPPGHDLGNAAGFRGWSGGARDGFVLSSTYATPGYLAGPIEPGVWAVALGPVVLSPWGMAWQVRVTMERAQPASADRSPPRKPARWRSRLRRSPVPAGTAGTCTCTPFTPTASANPVNWYRPRTPVDWTS
jgi:hypothetical protein